MVWDIFNSSELRGRRRRDIRQSRSVVELFASFFNEEPEKMITSFDAACVMYPFSDKSLTSMKNAIETDMSKYRPIKWHVDMVEPITRSNVVYQGNIALRDMHADHGTFGLIHGSLSVHDELVKRNRCWKKGSISLITQSDYEYLMELGCEEVALDIPMGSIVVWNSGLVHCALCHDRRVPVEERRWRYNMYVCIAFGVRVARAKKSMQQCEDEESHQGIRRIACDWASSLSLQSAAQDAQSYPFRC